MSSRCASTSSTPPPHIAPTRFLARHLERDFQIGLPDQQRLDGCARVAVEGLYRLVDIGWGSSGVVSVMAASWVAMEARKQNENK
ncbi:hypothetical protein ACO2RV_18610 [Ancylobacter sp. VNQ12]|uniref:hypothetical protein n=1 Tax=Ancylobacter sp. VNQ12 TaxID=3400920 RepID=UPI003C05F41B